jgi:protocatechuate 3,4-dioxygenase beta subunit
MARTRVFVAGVATLALGVFAFSRYQERSPGNPAPETARSTVDRSSSVAESGALEAPPVPVSPDAVRRELVAEAPEARPAPKKAAGEAHALTGQVVDDLGAPVPRFVIQLARPGEPPPNWGPVEEGLWPRPKPDSLHAFEDAQGTFRLEGRPPGQWRLTARSGPCESLPVVLDTSASSVAASLVVPRAATVAGYVLEASGAAIAEAEVHWSRSSMDFSMSLRSPEPAARTDAAGRFRIEALAPGTIEIMARHSAHAECEWEELALAPGELRTDLVLTLSAGGRIEGRVDPSLGALAHRRIDLFSFRGGRGWRDTETDEQGRFVIENVIPQSYVIELRSAGYGTAIDAPITGLRKNLRVLEGETTEVLFGGQRRQIHVHGKITQAGAPKPGLEVQAWSEAAEDRGLTAKTGADGRYELVVDGPGEYRVSVTASQDSYASFACTVPDEDPVERSFELPSGSISGRVLSADGRGLSFVPVTVLRDGPDESRIGFFERHRDTKTDSDGRFRFELLVSGTYALRAPDGFRSEIPPPRVPHGRVLLKDIALDERSPVRGLELRLLPEGQLSGQVIDAQDAPVGGAYLVVKDLEGWPLSASWETKSDSNGGFSVPSLAPGEYTLLVRKGAAETTSEPFRIEAERTTTIKVVLR